MQGNNSVNVNQDDSEAASGALPAKLILPFPIMQDGKGSMPGLTARDYMAGVCMTHILLIRPHMCTGSCRSGGSLFLRVLFNYDYDIEEIAAVLILKFQHRESGIVGGLFLRFDGDKPGAASYGVL